MAIDQNAQYPVGTAPASGDYPEGSAINSTAPGALDGYPFDKEGINDILGVLQALLRAGGVTASGNADTALASQYMQMIVELASGRAYTYDDTGAANAYVLGVRTNQQAPAGLFNGLIVRYTAANTNTGASTANAFGTGAVSIRDKVGAVLTAGAILAGSEIELHYDSVNSWYVLSASPISLLHIQDQKTSGTNGGTSIAGVQTRVLNTVVTNEIPGASLSANQITLPVGTFEVTARAPARTSDQHKAYLYDTTGTADLLIGSSASSAAINDVQTDSILLGRFTLSTASVLELRHYITTVGAGTSGLGTGTVTGQIEIYSDIQIRKVG